MSTKRKNGQYIDNNNKKIKAGEDVRRKEKRCHKVRIRNTRCVRVVEGTEDER